MLREKGMLNKVSPMDLMDEYAKVYKVIVLPISIGYFTCFFGNGQTPGMKAVKIKLCRTDGVIL